VSDTDDAFYFVAFINRSIRFLNGIKLTDAILVEAATNFEGRLSSQGLAEKIGSDAFRNVKELDLQNLKIKE
jgi:hypothetical protein